MRSGDVAHITYERQTRRSRWMKRTTRKASIQNEERDGKQEGDHDSGSHLGGLGESCWVGSSSLFLPPIASRVLMYQDADKYRNYKFLASGD